MNNPKYGADMTHVFNSQAPFSLSNVSMPRRDRIYLAPYYFAQQKPQKIKGPFKENKSFLSVVKKKKKAFGHIIILVLTQQRKPEELLHQTFQSD